MSGKVSGMVWELDIPHGHAWLLMSLADHAEHDGTKVFPGNGVTAWKTGFSVSTVKRYIKSLQEEYDLIELVESGGGKRASEYRIKIENFPGRKKAPLGERGNPKNGHQTESSTNPVHTEPGSKTSKPGSATRAHGETSSETSVSPEGAAEAATEIKEKPTNYMTLFADMAKNLGYEKTPEDQDELPKNFKLTAAKTDDATMRKVVWKVLDARANRNYSLSPQKALQELSGNVSDIGSRAKSEKGVTFDADDTPRYNGKKITFTDDGWEKQLWVGDMEDVGRWPEVLAAFRERGMEPEYKKIGSYWGSKGSA